MGNALGADDRRNGVGSVGYALNCCEDCDGLEEVLPKLKQVTLIVCSTKLVSHRFQQKKLRPSMDLQESSDRGKKFLKQKHIAILVTIVIYSNEDNFRWFTQNQYGGKSLQLTQLRI